MAPFVAPSSDLALTVGDIERKVDMSLDDIIKQSKGMDKKQHTKVKDWNRTRTMQPIQATQVQQTQVQQRVQQPYRRESLQERDLQKGRVPRQRKDLLQRFVSLRSSALRQEKLKEARARNGTSMIAATKAAGWQALSGNAVVSLNRFSRKATQGSVRPLGTAARYPKMFTAARNPKVLIVNQSSMTGASRRPDAPQIGPLANGVTAQPQRQHLHPNKVMARNFGSKPQTLDSRFASLREERQFQSHGGWRR